MGAGGLEGASLHPSPAGTSGPEAQKGPVSCTRLGIWEVVDGMVMGGCVDDTGRASIAPSTHPQCTNPPLP